jgi:hypothetical protein
MARASKLWPQWDVQQDNLTFLCEHVTRERYNEIGRYFTTKQFRKVERALSAPESFGLLDKLRQAVYFYLIETTPSTSKEKVLRDLEKRKRSRTLEKLIEETKKYQEFLDENYRHFLSLYSLTPKYESPNEREKSLQEYRPFEELRERLADFHWTLQIHQKRLSVSQKKGRKQGAEWDVFLWSVAWIWETVRGEPTRSGKRFTRGENTPFGTPILNFVKESLALIGVLGISEEGLESALRRYYDRGRTHVMNDLLRFGFCRAGNYNHAELSEWS